MCDCEMMPEFYDARFRHARKLHKCCECFAEISVGNEYQCISGKWDGDVMTFKTCMRCVGLRDEAQKKSTDHCGVCFEGLMEWLSEADEPLPTDYVERRENMKLQRQLKPSPSLATADKHK